MFPFAAGQLRLDANVGNRLAVLAAQVEAFAEHRLRRGDDDALHGQLVGDDQLVDASRADGVDVEVGAEVGQVVLIGGEMVDRVDVLQGIEQHVRVAHVAVDELGLR